MNLKYDILELTREYGRSGKRDIRGWVETHKYCYGLGYLVFFLAAFFVTERLVVPKYMISCPVDDWIPFHEYFVIPYLMWFLLLPASWFYTMITSKEDFQNLCMMMFGGMTISIVIYWLFPNGLDLRPESPGSGVCGELVRLIQAVDTPGNVCPSIHVSSSLSVAAAAHGSQALRKYPWLQRGIDLIVCGICLSTMFLKQHSLVDVVCGCLVTAGMAAAVYGLPWRTWMKGTWMEFFL